MFNWLNPGPAEHVEFKRQLHARIAENHRLIYAREHNGQRAEELTDDEIIAIWQQNRGENEPDDCSMEDMRQLIADKEDASTVDHLARLAAALAA